MEKRPNSSPSAGYIYERGSIMDIQAHRKDEHVFIAEKFYHAESNNQLDEVRLLFKNIPEISKKEVSLATELMGYKIDTPFFINAITGGSPQTDKINFKLAKVANYCHIPMATGSASVALKNEENAAGFKKLRSLTPNTLLFTNIGAGNDLSVAQKALQLTQADGLQIHLNVAQELVMPEGDRSFYWKDQLHEINTQLEKPLMVKEVGQGITPETLATLKQIGIKYVDLAGKGGTNFVTIENERRHDQDYSFLSNAGLSLAECLLGAQDFQDDFSITASGGIRNALEIVKSLVLGASSVGISGMFLHTLIKQGPDGLINQIENLKDQIKDIMVMLGCRTINELHQAKYLLSSNLNNTKSQLDQLI